MNGQRSFASSDTVKAILIVASSATFITGCLPGEMKLLPMEIYQNEQLVLRTPLDAPDREGPADFWRRAGKEPFASESEVARVVTDEDNLLCTTVTGRVQIKTVHADRLMTSAALTNVVLVRSAHDSLKWYLPPEEVQRASLAAGM